jgi:hypothetical protein
MKQKLLHLLVALLMGIFLASLPAICSVFVMGYFTPGETDDAGFSGVAAVGFGVIIYSIAAPAISISAYFFLRKFVFKEGQ